MSDEENQPNRWPPDRSWIEFETRRDVPPAALFWFPAFAVAAFILTIWLVCR